MMTEESNTLFKRGKYLAGSDMHVEAAECYRKAIKLCPNFAEAYNELGNTYLTLGNVEDAINCYRKATLFKPMYAEAWNNQGGALLIQGLYDEAVKCFEKVTEILPENIDAWIAQGSLMMSLCRYQEAVECFEKALKIVPGSAEALSKRNDAIKHLEASREREKKAVKKICLLGDQQVGKTSLIRRYVYGMFVDRYLPTVGAKITKKTTQVLGVELTLMLWDITGLEDFRTLHPTYYHSANGAFVICDSTRVETQMHLSNWVESIFKITPKIPVIFIANKIDMNRRFSDENILKISSEFNAPYLKTSAKTGENIERAFELLVEKMVFK